MDRVDISLLKFLLGDAEVEQVTADTTNVTLPNEESDKFNEDSKTNLLIPILGTVFGFIVGLILLAVYRHYKHNEIRRLLTRKDVREFYKGSDTLKELHSPNDYVISIEGGKYNKELEVDKANFNLSDIILGSGAFGEVWKGTVNKSGVEIEVAAKMLKKGCPTTTLKGFLSEIKVMGHLGNHENLVGIVGAYTKGLEKGKVIVFTELCARGSLETHLRNLGKALNSENDCETPRMDLISFHRWCFEIANGMEYLSSKNVVHADLATRNILLNDQLTAKISDFGLSRRLYDYTNYVKKQQEPLPWKWMSPESLQRLEFNEKTDVWAFGVTMWEIYSLGDVPYQGLNWTVNFSSQLINGLRMEKPLYDDGRMFVLMIKCWNVDPSRRPTFSEVKINIQSMERRSVHQHQFENEYENCNEVDTTNQNNFVV